MWAQIKTGVPTINGYSAHPRPAGCRFIAWMRRANGTSIGSASESVRAANGEEFRLRRFVGLVAGPTRSSAGRQHPTIASPAAAWR